MRNDLIGLFFDDSKLSATERKAKIFRPLAEIPNTGWKAPRDFPNLFHEKILGLDCETYDPELLTHGPGWARGVGHIVGVSIATIDKSWYFPIKHTIQPETNMDPEAVFRYLTDLLKLPTPKVGANIIYDTGWLQQEGVTVNGITYDIQYAEALLDDTATSYSLETIATNYLGEGKLTSELYEWCAESYGLKSKGRQRADIYRAPPCLVGPYAEGDAIQPLQILLKQRELLIKAGMWNLFEMECKLIPVLQGMRFRGIPVDVEKAEKVEDTLHKKLQESQNKLNNLAGFEVNVNIKPDLIRLFNKFNITYPVTEKGNPSFTRKFLAANDSDQAKAIINIRKYEKIKTTFIKGAILDKHINGKLYPSFHPLRGEFGGAVSGRYSSCLDENTTILTDNGTKKIKNIIVGDKVFTHKNNYQHVLTKFDVGNKDCYRITLSDGNTVTCTLEHRLLTLAGFKSLQDILNELFERNHTPDLETSSRFIKRSRHSNFSWKKEVRHKPHNRCQCYHPRNKTTKRSKASKNNKNEACSTITKNIRYVSRYNQINSDGSNSATLRLSCNYCKTVNFVVCNRRSIQKTVKIDLQQIKARQQKSNKRETRYKFQRCYTRWPRILNGIKTGLVYTKNKQTVYTTTSNCNVQSFRNNRNTSWVCCASCKRGSIRQRNRQLSPTNKCSTLKTARGYSTIRQINFVGTRRVYDLEIEQDHCFLANNIFVHNSNPNAQNIPARDEILAPMVRGIFIPEPGFDKWIKLDLNQIEYRIFAHISSDKKLIDSYQDLSTDYHSIVSTFLNDLLPRKIIKNFNFMSLFGGGKEKTIAMIAEALTTQQIQDMCESFKLNYITDEQALQLLGHKFVDLYADKFPAAKATLQRYSNLANETGEIRTLLNRRGTFNSWESSDRSKNKNYSKLNYNDATNIYGSNVQRQGTYKALNRITQGGSADILKKGMLDAYEAGLFNSDKLGFPHVTVHDELDFSFNDDLRKEALELKSIMENAIKLKVPVIMDIETGSNWGNVKEINWL